MRIVLAYSGSLEGSAAIHWLRARQHAEIVTVTLDLGQGRELEVIRDRALAIGAQRAHVLDTRDEFAQEFVIPALRADAQHQGHVPMALALSRPLIARKVIEIAGIERADAVAHTGHATAGTSQLDRLLADLAPALQVLTPAREWSLGEPDLLLFARSHGFGLADDDAPRIEANFWGRSLRHRRGSPLPPSFASTSPETLPGEPALVDISFVRGVPMALNGVSLPLTELVSSLGTLAAAHGVGTAQTGTLVCQAPAAVLLHAAHRGLTRAVTPPDMQEFSDTASAAYVNVVESSRWFSTFRAALDGYFSVAQALVNGHVQLRLHKGEYETINCEVTPPPAEGAAPVRLVPSSAKH
jgi:argininosuccinate synthase